MENIDSYVYTRQLRRDLYQSLVKRFDDFIENDCFILATYLDPVFGPKSFPIEKRNQVKQRLKYHIGLLDPTLAKKTNTLSETLEKPISSNYFFFSENIDSVETFDDMDATFDKYTSLISSSNYSDSLLFWKVHENSLALLAPLAKKFMGVPASSASVERMFYISGHVFSNKRRRTGVKLFENLVFLKLNENYM